MTRSSHRSFSRRALALASCLALSVCAGGCEDASPKGPPIPASSDPLGNDLVLGAVVVASEADGGYRLLKIIHVDDYPDPIGHELHMIAYDPKVATFEEGARLWAEKRASMTVALDHILVRRVAFLKRDYRALFVEPVTEEERAPYTKALRRSK